MECKNEVSIVRSGDPRTQKLDLMLAESSDPTDWNKAINLASKSDVIVAALGENTLLVGEARNRMVFAYRVIKSVSCKNL